MAHCIPGRPGPSSVHINWSVSEHWAHSGATALRPDAPQHAQRQFYAVAPAFAPASDGWQQPPGQVPGAHLRLTPAAVRQSSSESSWDESSRGVLAVAGGATYTVGAGACGTYTTFVFAGLRTILVLVLMTVDVGPGVKTASWKLVGDPARLVEYNPIPRPALTSATMTQPTNARTLSVCRDGQTGQRQAHVKSTSRPIGPDLDADLPRRVQRPAPF